MTSPSLVLYFFLLFVKAYCSQVKMNKVEFTSMSWKIKPVPSVASENLPEEELAAGKEDVLEKHNADVHVAAKCDICGESFASSESLKAHIGKVHLLLSVANVEVNSWLKQI